MSKDWAALAAIVAPDIPREAIQNASAALDALHGAFWPQLRDLPPDTEPAYVQMTGRDKEVGS